MALPARSSRQAKADNVHQVPGRLQAFDGRPVLRHGHRAGAADAKPDRTTGRPHLVIGDAVLIGLVEHLVNERMRVRFFQHVISQ